MIISLWKNASSSASFSIGTRSTIDPYSPFISRQSNGNDLHLIRSDDFHVVSLVAARNSRVIDTLLKSET